MKTKLLAALLVITITTAAGAAESDVSISAGGGLAYELLGLNLSARWGHVEPYAGIGMMSLFSGLAAGVRVFSREDGTGPFLAVNSAFHLDTLRIDERDATGGRLFWTTVTGGYRIAAGHVFAQASIGGGVIASKTFWSTPPQRGTDWFVFPDGSLAIGVRL